MARAAEVAKERRGMEDEQEVAEVLGELSRCAEVFGLLMRLVMCQDARSAVRRGPGRAGGCLHWVDFKLKNNAA